QGRSTRQKGGHTHCDSCLLRRCRARVEPSVCCPLSTCRLLCGALFHLCKEEEHLLLCPNVRVPCINAEFGCPLQMLRSARAEHLQYCPASVVSCSMEWNRWPVQDASNQNTELLENLMHEKVIGGCLDVAMALKDQDRLFHSLKMKKLFPELTQKVAREEEEEKKRREKENSKDEEDEEDSLEDLLEVAPVREPTQAEREAMAYEQKVDPELLVSYRAWESMFSKEMGGCREAGAGPGTAQGKSLGTLAEEDESSEGCSGASGAAALVPAAAGPKVKKNNFMYKCIEPMKIVTVRTFKIPTSFAARLGRIRNPSFYKRENKSVDTSDLNVPLQDIPVWEEIQASLLCSLEKEQRGHMIAESVSTDTLFQDQGTQTYHFLSAPFSSDASLWDLSVAKAPELHLQLQVESVTSRHHKASSAFTFLCGHSFQRREYGPHYKNIHCDIHMCVNDWFEQRCPLAYLGCTYSQRRFRPSTCEDAYPCSRDPPAAPQSRGGRRAARGDDPLSSLPYEVLYHVASFLDSLSLSQMALVSHLMRQVCSSQLQDRGMVTLQWERKAYSNGTAKWRVTHKVWEFSSFFSPVDAWCFRDIPPLSEHLRVCPYYKTEPRAERVLLPKIKVQVHNDMNWKGNTLVSLFKNKKLII
uniref:F-box protein 40, tandem duplicate 1 n=1 Tax=Neogobius melanostomus TaxID=47308 RepID=A0A8C6SR86_9GOBI